MKPIYRNQPVVWAISISVMIAAMLVACAPIQPVTEANAQPATGDSEAITAAVNAIWEEYAASLNAGDPNRWIAQWTEVSP